MKKCPLCNGSGYIKKPTKTELTILELYKKGLSMRQIGKVVGLKSSNTIWYHIHQAKLDKANHKSIRTE
jgi:DNA-binding NarL/FixJ family response regulator